MTPIAAARKPSIDLLRAIAITLMVVVHFVENLSGWWPGDGGQAAGSQRLWWLPAGFAAPIFTMLAGTSYRSWLEVQARSGRPEPWITKASVRRGLFLVGLGFAFNVLVWMPEDVFNWDVLTFIGMAMLVLAAMRHAPDGAIAAAAAVVVAVSPALQGAAGYPEYWADGYFAYDFTVTDVALGWLVTGYFPLFPWLAFPLAGYVIGPVVFDSDGAVPRRRSLAIGAGLVLASLVVILVTTVIVAGKTGSPTDGGTAAASAAAWTMFPASLAYVLGTSGGVVLAGTLAHALVDPRPDRWRWLIGWTQPLSRHALSAYLLHHAIHLWPLWAYGGFSGGEITAAWQLAMPPAASLGLALVFMAAAAVLFRWMDRHRIASVESLMRWLCD